MACVRKRRDHWVLDYRDQHGVRRWETLPAHFTKREADALLVQRQHEVGSGEYLPRAEEKTFAELSTAYAAAHIDVNIRGSTAKDYRAILRLHLEPYFGSRRLRTITPEIVERWRTWMVERQIGSRTINKAHTLLSAMLRYAMRHRWVADNAAAQVPKLRHEPVYSEDRPLEGNMLRPEEVRALLDNADEHWRPLLLMAVSTGLRQGELLGLVWGDIDWQAKQVHVRRQFTKGSFAELKTRASRRRVGLSDDVILALKAWKLRCPKSAKAEQTGIEQPNAEGSLDLVFPGDDGRPLNHGILLRSGFYPALRRAKLRHVRFHDLRHTFTSLLIAQNVHPKRIQALMGHSTIRITLDTYGHLMQEHDDGAAEKIAALLSGSKSVAAEGDQAASALQVLEKMEAGVGIEPAYTDLQSAA